MLNPEVREIATTGTPTPRVLVERVGSGVLDVVDMSFRMAPDGSVGVDAGELLILASSLTVNDTVWFRPDLPPIASPVVPLEEESMQSPLSFFDGELVLDREKYHLEVGGRVVRLAYKEYGLLNLLMQHPGKVLSRPYIYEKVWGDNIGRSQDKTLDVHVKKCRTRLGETYRDTIVTRRSVGYMFDPSGVVGE